MVEDDRKVMFMSKSGTKFVHMGPAKKKKNENRSADKVLMAKINFE